MDISPMSDETSRLVQTRGAIILVQLDRMLARPETAGEHIAFTSRAGGLVLM